MLLTVVASAVWLRAAEPPPAMGPSNDHFAAALPLIAGAAPTSGTTVGSTLEMPQIEEPFFNGTAGTAGTGTNGGTVWWTWTSPGTGAAIVTLTNGTSGLPYLGAFSGGSLTNLTLLGRNVTRYGRARVVFSVQPGAVYHIAVGTSATDHGTFEISLQHAQNPPNDNFESAIPITGNSLEISGSLVGASRQALEPDHGDTGRSQTLWWSWTAPTNATFPGLATVTADLINNAPPRLAVYTGGSFSGLNLVDGLEATNQVTRAFTFPADPGVTYRIALAGTHAPPDNVADPRFGSFRLSFVARHVGLSILGVDAVTNADRTTTFSAQAQLFNQGAFPSEPLRVRLVARAGYSSMGTNGAPVLPEETVIASNLPPGAPLVLGAGARLDLLLNGVLPGPFELPTRFGYGYGAYAEVESLVGTNWLLLDKQFLLTGVWPQITASPGGAGGGVIRLDPGLGAAPFAGLPQAAIEGPVAVPEGSLQTYVARATFSDNQMVLFTNTLWMLSGVPSGATGFAITNGLLTAGSLTANALITLVAQYSYAGLGYAAMAPVLVSNLPPPSLAAARAPGGGAAVQLRVSGVAGRAHVVESATNLNPPITWQPLATNFTTNLNGPLGLWELLQPIPLQAGEKFFRVRERD
jgi:hypothetical protein